MDLESAVDYIIGEDFAVENFSGNYLDYDVIANDFNLTWIDGGEEEGDDE